MFPLLLRLRHESDEMFILPQIIQVGIVLNGSLTIYDTSRRCTRPMIFRSERSLSLKSLKFQSLTHYAKVANGASARSR